MTLRTSLIPFAIIAISASIPLIILSIISGYRSSIQERQTVALQVTLRAERLAHQIESQLTGEIDAAQPLVNLRRLNRDDTSSFLEHAQRLSHLHPEWLTISLASPSGPQVLNTASEEGEPRGDNSGVDGFRAAVETAQPVVGGYLDPGVLAAGAGIPIHCPVVRMGEPRFVITVGIDARIFRDALASAGLPSNWRSALVDQRGRVIAGAGHPGDPWPAEASTDQPPERDGLEVTTGADGLAVYALSRKVGLSGWTLHLRIPKQDLDQPVQTAWRRILLAGTGTLCLTALLASLVARLIAARRRAEMQSAALVLRQSETWRLLAVEIADIGTWHWPAGADKIDWCDRCLRLFGRPRPPGAYASFLLGVHPDDRSAIDRAMQTCRRTGDPAEVDFRAVLADDTVRWLHLSGRSPERGDLSGLYGVLIAVDRQKKAEADHRDLLSRLHSAQEDERRRIARDLHDRVGQTVTGLSLRLKRLELQSGSERTKEACAELKRMIADISRDLHRAAVDLRPTSLDDIGLKPTLINLLDDWRGQTGLDVDVLIEGLDGFRLPPFVETTLYRILVELLTNIVKHADAHSVSITLRRRPGQVALIVEDDGRGFPPSAGPPARQRHLGLLGIRERLELVGGTLDIESGTGSGSVIFVRIPLSDAHPAEQGDVA